MRCEPSSFVWAEFAFRGALVERHLADASSDVIRDLEACRLHHDSSCLPPFVTAIVVKCGVQINKILE